MSDKKHPNDDYVNPGSATAAAPIPPETFAEVESAGASVEADEARAAEAVKEREKASK